MGKSWCSLQKGIFCNINVVCLKEVKPHQVLLIASQNIIHQSHTQSVVGQKQKEYKTRKFSIKANNKGIESLKTYVKVPRYS